MIKVKTLKKMVEDNRNGIPKDGTGKELKKDQRVTAKIIFRKEERRKVIVGGRESFLDPEERLVSGVITKVGAKESYILSEGEMFERKANNENITIIV